MNLRQLRYIAAVAKHGLNISAAAESLYTSQPGVSKQIKQLEDELGIQIFERAGRQLTRVTAEGESILELAHRALVEVDKLRSTAHEFSHPRKGHLSIATTQTQARYALPQVIEELHTRYPDVTYSLHQGNPAQIASMILDGVVDFVITAEGMENFESLLMFPCYRWRRAIVVPLDHPLLDQNEITLDSLASYPLVTYVFGFTGHSPLDAAFEQAGVVPKLALTATDADNVKTYVRMGLGVGIIAAMAYDTELDRDLVLLDASHLFSNSTVRIGMRHGIYLRRYMYDFIELYAPHLTRDLLDTVLYTNSRAAVETLFLDVDLPTK